MDLIQYQSFETDTLGWSPECTSAMTCLTPSPTSGAISLANKHVIAEIALGVVRVELFGKNGTSSWSVRRMCQFCQRYTGKVAILHSRCTKKRIKIISSTCMTAVMCWLLHDEVHVVIGECHCNLSFLQRAYIFVIATRLMQGSRLFHPLKHMMWLGKHSLLCWVQKISITTTQ